MELFKTDLDAAFNWINDLELVKKELEIGNDYICFILEDLEGYQEITTKTRDELLNIIHNLLKPYESYEDWLEQEHSIKRILRHLCSYRESISTHEREYKQYKQYLRKGRIAWVNWMIQQIKETNGIN